MADNEFTNKDRMRRRFAAIPQAIRAELHRVTLQNATELRDAQTRIVPVDSGDLRDSHKIEDRSDGVIVDVRVSAGDEKAFYARFVEFNQQPWFFPSYRALKRRMKSRRARAVNKAVKAAVTTR